MYFLTTVNTPAYAHTASLTGALIVDVYVSIHGNSSAASASDGSGHPIQLQPMRLEHSSVYASIHMTSTSGV